MKPCKRSWLANRGHWSDMRSPETTMATRFEPPLPSISQLSCKKNGLQILRPRTRSCPSESNLCRGSVSLFTPLREESTMAKHATAEKTDLPVPTEILAPAALGDRFAEDS